VDDGLTDTMAMADVMKSFGYAGTAFIDVNKIGTPGFITKDDLATLAKANWDISGHHMGNLTQMPPEQLPVHIDKTAEYLAAINTPGANLYALPNGARNAAIVSSLSSKFPFIFNIDGMSNDLKYYTPRNINRHSIDKHTSLAAAKKWVDDAKANSEWLIINFHTFTDTWEKEEDWSMADFTALLEYINEQKVIVVPVSTVVN
jgi:peptidoglycan/xylan/chitin deacetylase (PgdA/CDA1 family)